MYNRLHQYLQALRYGSVARKKRIAKYIIGGIVIGIIGAWITLGGGIMLQQKSTDNKAEAYTENMESVWGEFQKALGMLKGITQGDVESQLETHTNKNTPKPVSTPSPTIIKLN